MKFLNVMGVKIKMDLGAFFIFLIIFGIVGFITEKIGGLNPYKIYLDIGALILAIGTVFVVLPAVFNPKDINGNVNRIVNFFVKILPGAVVGDIAGSSIAEVTGGRR